MLPWQINTLSLVKNLKKVEKNEVEAHTPHLNSTLILALMDCLFFLHIYQEITPNL